MAVNLATKYAKHIEKVFNAKSYLQGKTNQNYDFQGVKGLKVYTPQSVPLVDYQRSGDKRFGDINEMQDTVQEYVMTQDKGFNLSIDKGNNAEQMNIKGAGKMLKLQIAERVVPTVEKYTFSRFVKYAGTVKAVAKPTKTTIASAVNDISVALDDAYIPNDDRFLYVTSEMYGLIRLCPEFLGVEKLAKEALTKGVIGEFFGFKIVKLPKGHLPENCFMLATHKSSVLSPQKLGTAKIHKDPPNIDGDLLQGRWIFDAFVAGARCLGVYALVLSKTKQTTPVISASANVVTILSDGAEMIEYTTDGTDPRFSNTAMPYSSAVDCSFMPKGDDVVIKAVAFKNGKFTSDVTEEKVTIV